MSDTLQAVRDAQRKCQAADDAWTAALEARLPALMARFRAAMTETCGFEWREVAP